MKYLFLDFDGVINNSTRAPYEYRWHGFMSNKDNHLRVVRLLEACHKHEVKVVVISTWRQCKGGVHTIGSYFRKFGMDKQMARDIFQYRTSAGKLDKRGEEILEFMEYATFNPKIDKMCILDDDWSHDIACFKDLASSCIDVNGRFGLTEENLINSLKMLDIE